MYIRDLIIYIVIYCLHNNPDPFYKKEVPKVIKCKYVIHHMPYTGRS